VRAATLQIFATSPVVSTSLSNGFISKSPFTRVLLHRVSTRVDDRDCFDNARAWIYSEGEVYAEKALGREDFAILTADNV
jgi:hypothetical protein